MGFWKVSNSLYQNSKSQIACNLTFKTYCGQKSYEDKIIANNTYMVNDPHS